MDHAQRVRLKYMNMLEMKNVVCFVDRLAMGHAQKVLIKSTNMDMALINVFIAEAPQQGHAQKVPMGNMKNRTWQQILSWVLQGGSITVGVR